VCGFVLFYDGVVEMRLSLSCCGAISLWEKSGGAKRVGDTLV
jgi:hypothetical protein